MGDSGNEVAVIVAFLNSSCVVWTENIGTFDAFSEGKRLFQIPPA